MSSINAIIYQSVFDSTTQRPVQQITNLLLSGLSTKDSTMNSDGGRLYGTFTQSGSTYTLSLYMDLLRSELVARATSTALGQATIVGQNNSGLSGLVNFAQYQGDDSNIVIVAFLSTDADLPMANLETLSDYDQQVGFAKFHLEAFEYMCQFVMTRDRSLLYDRDLIDANNLNGVTGGFDLSKCMTFLTNPPEFRRCSGHYAFYRIAERQGVADNTFCERAKASKSVVKGYMTNIELQFDENNDRVENKERSLRTFKISRA